MMKVTESDKFEINERRIHIPSFIITTSWRIVSTCAGRMITEMHKRAS